MMANINEIPEEARPGLQVDGGDIKLVNVNNKVSALKLKGVYGAAQRRNHV